MPLQPNKKVKILQLTSKNGLKKPLAIYRETMKYLEMAPLFKSALFSKVWNNNSCSNIAKSCRKIALVFLLRVGIPKSMSEMCIVGLVYH